MMPLPPPPFLAHVLCPLLHLVPLAPGPRSALSPGGAVRTLRTPPQLSRDHLFCSSVPDRTPLTPEPPTPT